MYLSTGSGAGTSNPIHKEVLRNVNAENLVQFVDIISLRLKIRMKILY
jgi:hypothetical protein